MSLPLPSNKLRNVFGGYWLALWQYLVSLVTALSRQEPPTYKVVITTIAAFTVSTDKSTLTGNAVGAIGAQDGATLAANDRVFLPPRTQGAGGAVGGAASGPWIVVDPGSAGTAFVLRRPPEYLQGSLIETVTFTIGQGSSWKGSEWRSFPATDALVVGTGDPDFWPREQRYTMTIGGAFAPVGLGASIFYFRTGSGFTATNTTGAHAFWASTATLGAGTGVLAFTGTASEVITGMAVNF